MLWLGTTLAAGCYAPSNNNAVCDEGSLCSNGALCSNGSCDTLLLDAPVQAVDACATAACVGAQLVGCGQQQACELGCIEDRMVGEAHCLALKPSNGFTNWGLAAGTLSVAVTGELVVDTGTGEITDLQASLPIRSAGEGLRDGVYFATTPNGPSVFAVHNLTIVDGAALRFVGAPAVVLLIDGDAVVSGRIDVSAGLDPLRPVGPGGGSGGITVGAVGGGCGGGGFGTSDMSDDGGGGGGGLRDSGGKGGTDGLLLSLSGASGAGCNIVDLQPLRGGSGGGSGGGNLSFGLGGHGGGALQLSVRNLITIGPSGVIVASGGGGGGGRHMVAGGGGGGGGGGAGGGILLEARVVLGNGKIFANGGGGGGGAAGAVAGKDGGFGQESTMPAQGGIMNSSTGQGGAGGTNVLPRDGRDGDSNGGGGGGSAGVIVVRSSNTMLTGVVSPSVRQLPMLTQ